MNCAKLTLVASTLALLGSVLAPTLAHAGDKRTAAVVINTTTRKATGSMGTARNSSDSKQQIGCWGFVERVSGQDKYNGFCVATTSTGVQASCTVDDVDPVTVPVFGTIKEDSYVSFTWTTAGKCADIRIENYSYWEPLAP